MVNANLAAAKEILRCALYLNNKGTFEDMLAGARMADVAVSLSDKVKREREFVDYANARPSLLLDNAHTDVYELVNSALKESRGW